MKKILMLLALAGLTSAAWAQNSTSEVVEYEVIQVQIGRASCRERV